MKPPMKVAMIYVGKYNFYAFPRRRWLVLKRTGGGVGTYRQGTKTEALTHIN